MNYIIIIIIIIIIFIIIIIRWGDGVQLRLTVWETKTNSARRKRPEIGSII